MFLRIPDNLAMRFRFWDLSLTRKSILIIIFLGVAFEAIYLPIMVRTALIATDYAPGFSTEAFMAVKPGDTLREVTHSLGHPFFYKVVSLKKEQVWHVLETSQNMKNLIAWQTNDAVLIYLEYAKPRRTKGNFHAREILVEKGVVKETRNYTYWD